MTKQISNTLIIGDALFDIVGATGKGLVDPRNIGFTFSGRSSACRSGYYVEYEMLRDAEENIRLYLRKLTCDGLQPNRWTNQMPLFLGKQHKEKWVTVTDTSGKEFEFIDNIYYDGFETPVPFTGSLYFERGFPNPQMNQTPEQALIPKESLVYEFNEGIRSEAFHTNREVVWSSIINGSIKSPFELVNGWPENIKYASNKENNKHNLGELLLDGKMTVHQVIRNHPSLTPDEIFDDLILPVLHNRFQESLKNDCPLSNGEQQKSTVDDSTIRPVNF